jgi:hypothetical protein
VDISTDGIEEESHNHQRKTRDELLKGKIFYILKETCIFRRFGK